MTDPKTQSMPLSAVLVRFADLAEQIKSRSVSDEVLRDLCDDYRLARQTLTRLRKKRPKQTAEVAEYTALVAELEDEIVQHLLDTAERKSS